MKTSDNVSRKVIEINEDAVKKHLGELVRGSVEETLNSMLDAEADALCNATRYERSPERTDTRAGHYTRKLETSSGTVKLKMPKLRKLPFETSIINRYQRREASVEEAMIEMYLAGVSVRRVEDITEALWGTKVSPSTVSNLNKKIYSHIEKWRNRPIEKEYPYVYMDGIVLKKTWAGEVRNISILVAIGVNSEGFREILGVMEGPKEDKSGWGAFLKNLKERGLKGTKLFITDKNMGVVESIADIFPDALWQRCMVHYYRNVFSIVPRGMVREVAAMLKAIHAQEDVQSAKNKAREISEKLKGMKLPKASKMIDDSIEETFTYMKFPREHHTRIRTNNPIERLLKEVRRRTKVIGSFPDGESAIMLVSARLRHVSGTKWGTRKYLNVDLLNEMKIKEHTA